MVVSIRILLVLYSLMYVESYRIRSSSIRLQSRRYSYNDGNSNGNGNNADYTCVLIVPTGIGASIGGYAGDALPTARLLSSICDTVITHPNVMNGAMMSWPMSNVLYVEGYALDEFSNDRLSLLPINKKSHKVGLLLDKEIEEDLRIRHLHVADAARATLGLDISQCIVTSRNVGVSLRTTETGASWGTINDTATLIEGGEELVKLGCTAIAVVVRFPEEDDVEDSQTAKEMFEAYRQGNGVDAIAVAEALISHVLTKRLMVPVAHAPAFLPMEAEAGVSPKAAAEELGYTFLPCVLNYLHRAPKLIKNHEKPKHKNAITADDVDAVVVPVTALGGPAVLSFLSKGVLIIAVESNKTTMKASYSDLFPNKNDNKNNNVIYVQSYFEAAGVLAAHKVGILYDSITPSIDTIPIKYL